MAGGLTLTMPWAPVLTMASAAVEVTATGFFFERIQAYTGGADRMNGYTGGADVLEGYAGGAERMETR